MTISTGPITGLSCSHHPIYRKADALSRFDQSRDTGPGIAGVGGVRVCGAYNAEFIRIAPLSVPSARPSSSTLRKKRAFTRAAAIVFPFTGRKYNADVAVLISRTDADLALGVTLLLRHLKQALDARASFEILTGIGGAVFVGARKGEAPGEVGVVWNSEYVTGLFAGRIELTRRNQPDYAHPWMRWRGG